MANRNHASGPSLARNNVGGAIIVRAFSLPGAAPDECRQPGRKELARVGTVLPENVVLAMKNRRALEDGGFIKVFARSPVLSADGVAPLLDRIAALEAEVAKRDVALAAAAASAPAAATGAAGETYRYAFHTGMGRWDVIEGLRLNPQPIAKEEAEALTKDRHPPARGAASN